MKNVMKKFYDLPGDVQVEMRTSLKEGELERMSFPYKGKLTEGVIFLLEEVRYLIPLSSIPSVKPDPILGTDLDFSLEEENH
jgi:hypothetical protein